MDEAFNSSLLSAAIQWVEEQSQVARRAGTVLTSKQTSIAQSVGVRRSGDVRLFLVDDFPLPQHQQLRELVNGKLGIANMDGITFEYGIFIRRTELNQKLLAHECRHVAQYEALGGIAGFVRQYLDELQRFGYHDAPL